MTPVEGEDRDNSRDLVPLKFCGFDMPARDKFALRRSLTYHDVAMLVGDEFTNNQPVVFVDALLTQLEVNRFAGKIPVDGLPAIEILI